MTTTAVVVGCDAVDADTAWARLHVAGGHLKTLDWNGISMAALLRNDEHMTFKGDLEQITALRSTHDPLWIESADGIAVVLLEKQHPKRDAILAAFQEHLGTRWWGNRLTTQEAGMRMFNVTAPARRGFPKAVIVMIAMSLLMFLGVLLLSILRH